MAGELFLNVNVEVVDGVSVDEIGTKIKEMVQQGFKLEAVVPSQKHHCCFALIFMKVDEKPHAKPIEMETKGNFLSRIFGLEPHD
jgi:hypothetical protein